MNQDPFLSTSLLFLSNLSEEGLIRILVHETALYALMRTSGLKVSIFIYLTYSIEAKLETDSHIRYRLRLKLPPS